MNNSQAVHTTTSIHLLRKSVLDKIGRLTCGGAVAWLALKDWLTSSATNYPYADSLATSLAILCCGFAALYCSRPALWRDSVVAVSAVGALYSLLYGSSSLFALRIMPAAGILLCAFAFPLPQNPSWVRLLPGATIRKQYALRRVLYSLAALLGIGSLCVASAQQDRDMKGVGLALLVVALASATRFMRRFAGKSIVMRRMMKIGFLATGFAYGGLFVKGLLGSSNVSFMGSGVGSGTAAYSIGSSMLAQWGLLWIVTQCLLVWLALDAGAGVLDGRINDLSFSGQTMDSAEERGVLALWSGAIAALLAYIIVGISSSAYMFGDSPAGICVIATSAASLAIAYRDRSSGYARTHSHRPHLARLVALICPVLVVVIVGLFWLSSEVNSSERRAQLTEKAYLVPADLLPDSLLTAASTVGMPVASSPSDLHTALRCAFGQHLTIQPSMALCLASEYLSGVEAPDDVRKVVVATAAQYISFCSSKKSIEWQFFNSRKVGAPKPGLRAAAQYFFHKPLSSLSVADAAFLIAPGSVVSRPFLASPSQNVPLFATTWNSQYKYEQVLIGLPHSQLIGPVFDTGWVEHDGQINDVGDVAGTIYTNQGPRAFVSGRGHFTELSNLNSSGSYAVGINDLDQAVGYSDGHATMWDASGHVHDLGTLPGFTYSVARAINNKSQVVGYSYNDSTLSDAAGPLTTTAHAFLWQSGKMVDLGVSDGDISSRAYAINDAGEVAGWVLTKDVRTHAMVWQNGKMQDIGTLGGDTSIAVAINRAGLVVGSAQRLDGSVAPFLWQGGVMHDLGRLAYDGTARPVAINDLGQVVGRSFARYGAPTGPFGRAFVWDAAHGMRDLGTLLDANDKHRIDDDQHMLTLSVNDKGQIFGIVTYNGRHGFVLQPESQRL